MLTRILAGNRALYEHNRPIGGTLPLYRRLDKNMQLLDFKCVEFADELLYGKYRKRPR